MNTAISSKWLGFRPANLPNCLCLILVSAVLAGCSGGKPELLTILGSNTVGEELAPRLIAEYKQDHPNVGFELEFKGTGYGIGALMVGRCDIAAASPEVTTNEVELARARSISIGGTVQTWQDVGGPDAPVNLYIRHPISGTHLGFRELAMENKPYALHLRTFTNYTEIVQALAQDPHGIGYTTIPLANSPGVKPVSIGGVAPTIEAVNSGQYPYARILRLYTDKANETPAAQDFLQFVQSERGQTIVNQMGFAPRR